MNASKERCRKAIEDANFVKGFGLSPEQHLRMDDMLAFLVAACNKLPSEAAYGAEQRRHKQPKGRKAVSA